MLPPTVVAHLDARVADRDRRICAGWSCRGGTQGIRRVKWNRIAFEGFTMGSAQRDNRSAVATGQGVARNPPRENRDPVQPKTSFQTVQPKRPRPPTGLAGIQGSTGFGKGRTRSLGRSVSDWTGDDSRPTVEASLKSTV